MSYRPYGPHYTAPGGTLEEEAADLVELREKVVIKPPSGRVVVLVSGGLDSATLLGLLAVNSNFTEVLALNLSYGQHSEDIERIAAANIAHHYGVDFRCQEIARIGGGALTSLPPELIRTGAPVAQRLLGVPTTYVPHRNMILLAYAATHAYTNNCAYIAYGAHQVDAPYPDCRRSFVKAMETALQESCDCEIHILAPFLEWGWGKTHIVELGLKLGVPYELTYTCYKGGRLPCGECDACLTRIEAFRANNAIDPVTYMTEVSWKE